MENEAYVGLANKISGDADSLTTQQNSAVEAFLLCGTVASLLVSCIVWSLHKQAWMDEIFTWRELSDPSLWHLYSAIQHGADGGMPVFYTTGWLWAKVFGTGVLALRLYSSIAMSAALLITWKTLRRFYGMWATAFGVLMVWGTSGLLLDQNAEARFYGLFMLVVAIAIDIYSQLVVQAAPKLRLLLLSTFCQAVLVLTHVLGIIYGGWILMALALTDAGKRRFRPRVYLFHAAGWLALLLWIPAIQASIAAGRPHGWIVMPNIKFLVNTYLFDAAAPWLSLLERHSNKQLFQIVSYGARFVMLVLLAAILLLGLRKLATTGERNSYAPRRALLLVAYLILCTPLLLFVLSHLITPVFVPRYLLPCGIALAIVLADFSDGIGVDTPTFPSRARGWIAGLLAISPVISALALPPLAVSWEYLDVQRLDRVTSPNIAVVAGWQEDFAKLMRFSHDPPNHYYFLLDWPAALAGPRSFVLDFHLMSAYREVGYYAQNIQDKNTFLCSHTDFFVLDAHPLAKDHEGLSWFDLAVRNMPQFEWKILNSFDAPQVQRNLITVHRKYPLPGCKQP